MAIILRGKTRCPICGQVLEKGQKLVAFSKFISDQADPLAMFDDAALHEDCFRSHPLAGQATERWDAVLSDLSRPKDRD